MNTDERDPRKEETSDKQERSGRETTQENRKDSQKDLTGKILQAAFEVSNSLGCGFLEKVYESALAVELQRMGVNVLRQVPVRVLYRGQTVGEYVADMVAEGSVLIEVKATADSHPVYVAQTLNYLRAMKLPVGLLLNFGQPRLAYRRLVFRGEDAKTDAELHGTEELEE